MSCGCIENHLTSLILVGIMASIPFMVYLYWKHIKLRKTKSLQILNEAFWNKDGIE